MEATDDAVTCKFCHSDNVIRYGRFRGIQRWWCKDCQHKFASNGAKPNMKTPNYQVSSAVGMYYEGLSLNAVRKHLEHQFNIYPSDSTVYEWIIKYSIDAFIETKDYRPKVGDVWLVDDTTAKIGGSNVWLWDVIDLETRYIVLSKMTISHTTHDAVTVLESAAEKANKTPQLIVTRKTLPYQDAVEISFGADTEHIVLKAPDNRLGNDLLLRFHNLLRQRNRVIRGLKNRKSVETILNGWQVHQNYFKLHADLDSRTPSEMAGIDLDLNKNWFIPLGQIREVIESCRKEL